MAKRTDLKMLKVMHPGKFLANFISHRESCDNYEQWHKEMNDHLNELQSSGVPYYQPSENEICAAFGGDRHLWHRVKITSVIHNTQESRYNCYMLDEGAEFSTTSRRLMKLPSKYLNYPVKVNHCSLWGLQPLTMTIEIGEQGLEAKKRPCEEWDHSATYYMNDQIEKSLGIQADLIEQDEGSVWHVILYLLTWDGLKCFNEMLVEESYAVHTPGSLEELATTSREPPPLVSEHFELAATSRVPPSLVAANFKANQQLAIVQNRFTFSVRQDTFKGDASDSSLAYKNHQRNLVQSEQMLSTVIPDSSDRKECFVLPQPKQSESKVLKKPGAGRGLSQFLFDQSPISPGAHLKNSLNVSSHGSYMKQHIETSAFVAAEKCKATLAFNNSCKTNGPLSKLPITQLSGDDKRTAKSTTYITEKKSLVDLVIQLKNLDPKKINSRPNDKNVSYNYSNHVVIDFLSSMLKTSSERKTEFMTVRYDQPLPKPFLGILAHGKSLPTLTINVVDVPFHEAIQKVLIDTFEYDMAQGIETFVWPAALSCRHIVAVSPARKDSCLSYVPVLLSMLLNTCIYLELPRGIGPLSIILVPSWRKAREISAYVEEFTSRFPPQVKHLVTVVLYAGGSEENESVQQQLLKGCDLLISTPNSLLRMLEQECTSLRRLCHLVFDETESISARFSTEVEDIMKRYKLLFVERRKLTVPTQIMLFASHWDNNISLFQRRYTKEPIVVISSQLEAAVYGDVKQVVTMTLAIKMLATYCNVIDTLTRTTERVVTFTSDATEAKELHKACISRGAFCLLIHDELTEDEINAARTQWLHSSLSKQFLVMICTDSCYQLLAITNATRVIHYGLPDSKTKFGNRLSCMLDYFRDRTSEQEPSVQPVSHVILSEQCPDRAHSLYEIMKRCVGDRNEQFEHFVHGYLSSLENDPKKPLCPYLKSFGLCIHKDKCKSRHSLLPTEDTKSGSSTRNTLPTSGEVTVKIIRVKNASCFYCHLLEHKSADSVKTDLRFVYQKLCLDIAYFYSKESNHAPFVASRMSDELCGFQDKENIFYRAKVIEVITVSKSYITHQYRIWLVDNGCEEKATIEQLKVLPAELAQIPYQAVEIVLSNIQPMDFDYEWTDKANIYVDNLINKKTLRGSIQMSMGSTLWLSHVCHMVNLEGEGHICDFRLRHELLDKYFARPHPGHMKSLYEMCRGKMFIAEELLCKYFDYCLDIELKHEVLPSSQNNCVALTFVDSPSLFFVQLWDKYYDLSDLEDQIQATMTNWQPAQTKETFTLGIGSVCLATSTIDDRWYRCKVTARCNGGLWEVFMLDYGDKETLPSSQIRPLPRRFTQFPCQAIECELAHVTPPDSEVSWSNAAKDVMCDLSYFMHNKKKKLNLQVVSVSNSNYSCGQKYVVDICYTKHETQRFSEELVRRHLAVCAESTANIKPLLVKSDEVSEENCCDIFDCIINLCVKIYWNAEDVCQRAVELQNIMSYRNEGWDSALIESGAVHIVVKLIGYVPNSEAHGKVLSSLVSCCKDSERVCESAVEEKLYIRLVNSLDQTSCPDFQLQAAEALSHLITLQKFCSYVLQENILNKALTKYLSFLANEPVKIKILRFLCMTASYIVELPESNSLVDKLVTADTVNNACVDLSRAQCEDQMEPWLQLLSAISSRAQRQKSYSEIHQALMKTFHLDLLFKLLNKVESVKCTYYLLLLLKHLVMCGKKYKTQLHNRNLYMILGCLLKKDLQSPAVEVCRELRSEMNLSLPKPEALAGVPVQVTRQESNIIEPKVEWSQTKNSIYLKFIVSHARPDCFKVSCDRISCRVECEDKSYSLDWELSDMVIPDKTRIQTQESISYLKLLKETPTHWRKLLKHKVQSGKLVADFEHVNSSEEDDIDDPEKPILYKVKQPMSRAKDYIESQMLATAVSSEDEDGSSDEIIGNSDSDSEFIMPEDL